MLMSFRLKLYIAGAVIAFAIFSGVLWHFYAKGRDAEQQRQVVAIQKTIMKNRKADARIDHATPSADKSAALEWLRHAVRQ